MQSQLTAAFANSSTDGENFATIITARSLAEEILNQKIKPGTPAAKLVDESVEQGFVQAAQAIVNSDAPQLVYERLVDLSQHQPLLRTR